MRNQAEKEAGKWYLELRESGTKYIAIYKERLDSLMSYQRKLNQIIDAYLKPPNEILYTDTVVRAIAELHRIEMSLYTLFKETPVLDITSDNKDYNAIKNCRCVDIITHCKCKHCKEVWCPTEKGQDWCPNPDCKSGLKGCEFEPWDEKRKWVQCVCRRWFKLPEILEKHRSVNCVGSNLPPAIEVEDGCLPDGEPIVHQDQVMPLRNNVNVNFATVHNEEEVESEAWANPEPKNNDPPVKKRPSVNQDEERIPAHFYHKLGPRDVAKANANKNRTVYTS